MSDEALHETHLSSESQHQPLAAPYYNYNQAEVASDLASPYYPDYTYSQPSGPTALSSGNWRLQLAPWLDHLSSHLSSFQSSRWRGRARRSSPFLSS